MYKELQAFLDYKRESENYSRNTYLSYKRILERFTDFIGHDTDVKTIRKNQLQDYINSLPDSLKGVTINSHIYIIRLFFKFLLEFDYVEGDVSSVLKTKDQVLKMAGTISNDAFFRLVNFRLYNILDYRDKQSYS